ncbi:O-antigen ligase family protein [Olleya sp. YS]|uniref:O-antigen ligase family protein n=1 Tax=Olleya sp. YS TaxID=3028318 RepID=UPI0024342475|nr:O-antigen ligase family protein [Olleya sp. YS]WGD35314.1 O-antigen ligase family protein [Olleya sp. YS]
MKELSNTTKISDYIIVVLYLLTVFVPNFGAFDFASTQWFYLGILNTGVFIFYLFNLEYLSFSMSKYVKLFFGIQLAIFLVSCISMTQSIIIDESVIYLSRIFTFICSVFNLFLVFRRKKGFGFLGLSIVMSIILFIESFEVVYYFFSRLNELRTEELIFGIPHRYGNPNILGSAIVIKLPFLLYLFLQLKGLKKIISLVAVLFVITSLLLIGARTSVLIMLVVLATFSIAYFVVSKYSFKKSIGVILPLFITAIIAYGSSISVNKIYKDKFNTYNELFFPKSEKDLYNPKAKTNLIQGSGREYIWKSAIKDFKTSPIIGVGIGNWRHNSKKELLINYDRKGFLFSTHVHNDFLQALAETGVIGFLLYVIVYVLSFIILIQKYRNLKTDLEKFFLITIALALLSYAIDAFFNFPHHRAPIQIILACILAIILSFSISKNKNSDKHILPKSIKIIGSIITVIMFINLFSHYKDYKSSTVQYTLMGEVKTKDAFTSKFNYTYDQVSRMLPDFPYVNQIGMTNDDIKAMYAINSKQYKKANVHLDKSIATVENNIWPKTLKAMVFNATKKEDSALFYSKEVFDLAPSIESNFYILRDYYKRKKDTAALFNLYDRHFRVRPKNILGWIGMSNDIRRYYRDDSLALSKINYALESFPYDENLLKFKSELKTIMSKKSKSDIIASTLDESVIEEMTKYFQEGNKYFNNKDYANARVNFLKVLNIEPNNLPTHFKLGLLENLTKNYQNAIPYFTKVIDDKYLDNGRPEYSRGVSYLKLNDMANAKKDFLVSRQKGWQAALNLNDSFFE